MVETYNLFENTDSFVKEIYDYFSRRYNFLEIEYFPFVKLMQQKGNYHVNFSAIKKIIMSKINLIIKKHSRLKDLKEKILINRCVEHSTVVVNIKLENYKITSVRLNRYESD